jgi:hypothetical protein
VIYVACGPYYDVFHDMCAFRFKIQERARRSQTGRLSGFQ